MVGEIWGWLVQLFTMFLFLDPNMKGGEFDVPQTPCKKNVRKFMLMHILKWSPANV